MAVRSVGSEAAAQGAPLLSLEELRAQLQATGEERYHHKHPFHLLMHEGKLTRGQLQNELLQIWQRTGVTIIFVTHSVEEAVLLADRVLVMSAGPGRIDSDFRIDLARPRDVSSPEFNVLRRDIARRLTSHLTLSRLDSNVA